MKVDTEVIMVEIFEGRPIPLNGEHWMGLVQGSVSIQALLHVILLTFTWENSRILCTVLEFLVKMKRGRVIEGLRYHAADVANIIKANDDVVNSSVVIDNPAQAL